MRAYSDQLACAPLLPFLVRFASLIRLIFFIYLIVLIRNRSDCDGSARPDYVMCDELAAEK